jgi:hypothetical protein
LFARDVSHDSELWAPLGIAMGRADVNAVTIEGRITKLVQCFACGIEFDPDDYLPWFGLAKFMPSNQKIVFEEGGKPFSALDCALECVRLDPFNYLTWYALGCRIPADIGFSVPVNGVRFTKVQALQESLRLSPHNSDAWDDLARAIADGPPGLTIQVGNNRFSRVQMVLEAIKCDPQNAWAWNQLGYLVETIGVLSINGTVFSRRDCFMESLRLDPTLSDSRDQLMRPY